MKKESLFLVEVFDRQDKNRLCKRRFTKDIGLVEDWVSNNVRKWYFGDREYCYPLSYLTINWINDVECEVFHTVSDFEITPIYTVKVTQIGEIQ